MANEMLAKKDYIFKYVRDESGNLDKTKPIILLPYTTVDCVYYEDSTKTLGDFLKTLEINKDWLEGNSNFIDDSRESHTNTYSSAKIEVLLQDLYNKAINNSEINGLLFEIDSKGRLTVTYEVPDEE